MSSDNPHFNVCLFTGLIVASATFTYFLNNNKKDAKEIPKSKLQYKIDKSEKKPSEKQSIAAPNKENIAVDLHGKLMDG